MLIKAKAGAPLTPADGRSSHAAICADGTTGRNPVLSVCVGDKVDEQWLCVPLSGVFGGREAHNIRDDSTQGYVVDAVLRTARSTNIPPALTMPET